MLFYAPFKDGDIKKTNRAPLRYIKVKVSSNIEF